MNEDEEEKRLNLRLKIPDYIRIELAAQEWGISVSAFMRIAALQLAETIEDEGDDS
jgi:uncharacterized protein (DUF1778 family)